MQVLTGVVKKVARTQEDGDDTNLKQFIRLIFQLDKDVAIKPYLVMLKDKLVELETKDNIMSKKTNTMGL